jgi:hypothetical protein
MKIKAVAEVKGKLFIQGIYSPLRAGDEIEVSSDIFNSYQVQMLLRNKMLESKDYKKSSLVDFKNNTNRKIPLSFGPTVMPNQTFSIASNDVSHEQIKVLLKNGIIEKVSNTVEKQVEKTEKPKSKIKIKKVEEEKLDKSPKSMKEIMDEQKIPEGVHVHDPSKDKNISFIEEKIAQIQEEADAGFDFVDKKQLKEKLVKLQKSKESKQSN